MDKDDELVRLRIDEKTEILVRPENATREYAEAYKKRLLKKGARMRTYRAEIVEIFGYVRSIDFRFGSYEDLERMEDLSERIKMGIDKE